MADGDPDHLVDRHNVIRLEQPRMKLELRREGMVIIPENDQDKAYLEDTIGIKENGHKVEAERVCDVALGFESKLYVLKIAPKK